MKKESFEEMPYDKFMHRGEMALSDRELLAIILQTGSVGMDVLTLAGKVLEKASLHGNGIGGLPALSLKELMEIEGIGQVKAIKLKAVLEIVNRIQKAKLQKEICCNKPQIIAEYFMQTFLYEETEHVVVLLFDIKMHLLGYKTISVGTVKSSLVSARDIFLYAISMHAVQIVLLHNHPSGDATPSREDYLVTQNIYAAGKILDIMLADHIILGNQEYFSFLEHQVSPFCGNTEGGN